MSKIFETSELSEPVGSTEDVVALINERNLLRREHIDLRRELAAAQTKLRAQEGLQRIAETERDQYKAKLAESIESERLALRNNESLRARLAHYEAAEQQLPEEPKLVRRFIDTTPVVSKYICQDYKIEPDEARAVCEYLVKLSDYAIAQTVHADENERDARRYRWLRTNATPGLFNPAFAARSLNAWKTGAEIDAAIDAALTEPKT